MDSGAAKGMAGEEQDDEARKGRDSGQGVAESQSISDDWIARRAQSQLFRES